MNKQILGVQEPSFGGQGGLLIRVTTVQECDATDDGSSNAAD